MARRRGRINIYGYLLWIAVLAMTLLRAGDAAAPETLHALSLRFGDRV